MSSVAWARWRKPICMNDCLDGYWGEGLFFIWNNICIIACLCRSLGLQVRVRKKSKIPRKNIIWSKLLWDNIKPRILPFTMHIVSLDSMHLYSALESRFHKEYQRVQSLCSRMRGWSPPPPGCELVIMIRIRMKIGKLPLGENIRRRKKKTSYFTKKSCGISGKRKTRQRRQ